MNGKQWEIPEQIWQHPNPSEARAEHFRAWVNKKHSLNLKDYYELHDYSIKDWTFWTDLWEYFGIVSSKGPSKIIVEAPQEDSPEWFPGAKLNYAENILLRSDDAVACTAAREHGPVIDYSFRQLREMVRTMASAMRAYGLGPRDRVAAIITNSIDAVVIMLAATGIGAIYSSTATDMGVQGILERYQQIKPKLVFSETEVIYAGKRMDLHSKIVDVVQSLAKYGLQNVILLPSTVTGKHMTIPSQPQTLSLQKFLGAAKHDEPLIFAQLPFNHPLFVLYSSGTSGPPKAIVHTAGGVLIQTKKDYCFAMDVHKDDVYFQYTTCAWMMWNAMIANLGFGARIILYDGSPFHPDVRGFLKFIDGQQVTHFGTSPRFMAEVQGRGLRIMDYGGFKKLRVLMVTGAILTPPAYLWIHSQVPKTTHILAGSGGTDICSAFVGGCTALPGYAGEMQAKALGMDVQIFDEEGVNIEHTGQPGELVCTRAHPSLPLEFWGDVGRKRLRDAYFAKYPGIWTQGDFMVINPLTKGIYVLGRSDGVLNPSGVRFGSGEIYTVMEKFQTMIDDCLCIGQRRPKDMDERVLLFVKMRPEFSFTEKLQQDIRAAIRNALSTRHVPSYIFEVSEIPYTVNNKKIEIAVKQIVSGNTLKPSGTVANPDSLKQYQKFYDLEKLVGTQRAKL